MMLVVAFDGLDYELAKEFDLDIIDREESGTIKNNTGMSTVMTSELFASFITGENYETHGIKGLNTWNKQWVGNIEQRLEKYSFFKKFTRLRRNLYLSLLGARQRRYRKEDLECETLFEKIPNSQAFFIPSYNPSVFWVSECGMSPLQFGYTPNETMEHFKTREFRYRKKVLMNHQPAEFTMFHIHKLDHFHHMIDDFSGFDQKKDQLREAYQEIDEFAKEIEEKFSDKYDTIVFMSDHGLPTETEHNKNAFYSSNTELFGSKTPKITDFHDKIFEETDDMGYMV